jgi:hypothetical protein
MGRDLYGENAQLKKQLTEVETANVLKELLVSMKSIRYLDEMDEYVVNWEELQDLLWLYIRDCGG